jgi:hypothetical protein
MILFACPSQGWSPLHLRRWRIDGGLCRIALLALLAAGCAARPPLTSQQLAALDDPPPQVVQKVARFSPPTVAWIESVERDFEAAGRSLTPAEIQMATEIGVKEPERIRVVVAKAFPLPDDPPLRALLTSYGLGSRTEGGRTMGTVVFLKPKYQNSRSILAHEMVHVAQIERLSLQGFISRYLTEIEMVGDSAPLEAEGYRKMRKYR